MVDQTTLQQSTVLRRHESGQRTGSDADWTALNPILGKGEIGYASDTGVMKVGDGRTAWSGLTAPGTATYAGLADMGVATKRVTLQAWGDGSSNNTASAEWCTRILWSLPVTTTRWRLRAGNQSGLLNTLYTGTVSATGLYIGTPLYPTAGEWDAKFTGAAVQALPAFDTAADGSEYISAWVTDPTLQFNANQVYGISMGCTRILGNTPTVVKGTTGITYTTAGDAARSGNATIAGTPSWGASLMDVRIEYEAYTPLSVGLFVGDSITAGDSGDGGAGCYPHQTWPGSAGMRGRYLWANTGVGSSKSSDWITSSWWRWTRNDVTTTVPDFAVIAIGSNDVFASVAAATIQANTQTMIGIVRGMGIKRIYLATIIPRNFTGGSAQEISRTAYNTWVRLMPSGVHGVFDHDKVLRDTADHTLCDADLLTTQPHPLRGGYQVMAQQLAGLR